MPDSPENRLCRIQRAIELQAVEGIGLVYASAMGASRSFRTLERG